MVVRGSKADSASWAGQCMSHSSLLCQDDNTRTLPHAQRAAHLQAVLRQLVSSTQLLFGWFSGSWPPMSGTELQGSASRRSCDQVQGKHRLND